MTDCVESLATDAVQFSIQLFGYIYSQESLKRKAAEQIPGIVLSIVRNVSMTLEDILTKYEIPSATSRWNARSLVGSSAVLLRRIQA